MILSPLQQSFNICDIYEMHQRTCLFKTTGKRSGEHLDEDITRKKLKDNVNCAGGALDSTLVDYRLDLEGEQQDASNVLNVLEESIFQMENQIIGEVVRKKAVTFYLSLHANFHLSCDETFLTNPPAVLNTNAMEVNNSSGIHNALNCTYGNIVSAIGDFQQRGSGLEQIVVIEFTSSRVQST